MKTYSPNIKQLLELDNLSPYFLVTLELSTGTIYHTNTPMDVNIIGLGSFSSDNSLLAIEAPRLSSVVDRETYKITYSDNNFAFKALFESGIVGTPVTVYIGFYNSSEVVINNVLPGNPLNNIEDLVIAYKGFIDSHGHTTDVESEVTAVIECSSPMASLDLTKPFYTSRDSMRQINPTDTSFDDVYSGSKAINLLWGKK
jgi:hypothetical protein